jgi:hypothetical protein
MRLEMKEEGKNKRKWNKARERREDGGREGE